MTPAYVVQFTTPKKFILNGLWYGPKNSTKVVIFIHGLTGSLFGMSNLSQAFRSEDRALLVFNNRGFEQITEIKQKRDKKSRYIPVGAGHEVFTDSADDIQGAIDLAKKNGAKEIYLAGHSTGAQKAYYWAAINKREKKVKGIILLGPLSDYAIAVEQDGRGRLAKSLAYARKLVRAGKPNELMPRRLGPWFVCDAQRFLSLYTPDSKEEIFTYSQQKRRPTLLQKVTIPTLVLLAGSEEHTKRPAKEIALWFENSLKNKHKVVIVPNVGHSFRGGEKKVAATARAFMKER